MQPNGKGQSIKEKNVPLHELGHLIIPCQGKTVLAYNPLKWYQILVLGHELTGFKEGAISAKCKTVRGAVFSLNFSSAGKGRLMAGKAQDMCQRGGRGEGGGGIVECGTWLGPCCEILELRFLRRHSLYFKQIGCCFFRQQFKMFDSNNFTLSSMHSFQNAWPIKRKAAYTLVLFDIFIYLLSENRIGSQLACVFLTLLFKF